MPPSLSLLATGRVLAQWQHAGHVFSPLDYLKGLSEFGDRERFNSLIELARTHGLPEDGTLAAVALAALAGAEQWREQAIHFLLLPLLGEKLESDGATILSAARIWSDMPLKLSLTETHIRTLADQCVGKGRLGVPQARALLTLFAWVASPQGGQSADPFLQQLMAEPDLAVLVGEALRFWNTAELVPALLARLVPATSAPDCTLFMAQLRCIRGLLNDMGWQDSDVRKRLAPPFAAMVAATAEPVLSGERGIPVTFLYKLLEAHYPEVCDLLGVDSPAGAAPWYQEVIHFLEGQFVDPARVALCQAWVRDLSCSWMGGGAGRFLISALYSAWYEAHPADSGATEQLVSLLRSAADLGGPVEATIIPLLRQYITSRRPAEMAARYLHTLRMLREPLPHSFATCLLVRLLHARPSTERVGVEEAALLARWELLPDRLVRAVAKVARALGTITDEWVSTLLWEILLSPATRWPSLRARVQRALNVAHLRNASHGELAAMRRVLWLLNAEPPAR